MLTPAIDLEELAELRRAVESVYVDPLLARWIVDLVRTTREIEGVAVGASVRGSLSLERAARAWALLHGRVYVVPEDVERLFGSVLVHRIVFAPTFLAEARKHSWRTAIGEFVQECLAVAPVRRLPRTRSSSRSRRAAPKCSPLEIHPHFARLRTLRMPSSSVGPIFHEYWPSLRPRPARFSPANHDRISSGKH